MESHTIMSKTDEKSLSRRPLITDERGLLLINMAFMILVLGGILVAGTYLFEVWSRYNTKTVSENKMAYIQNSLEQYYTINRRYPCPAPLNAPIDGNTGGTNFGVEISNTCPATGDIDGTFASAGRLRADGTARGVRTGAVPVRTLGIPDDYIFNSDKQRFVYAITTDYADNSKIPLLGEEGAISIQDRSGNNSTNETGNIVHLVMSPGTDKNGAYDLNGNIAQPCDATLPSGENCNYASNALFINSIIKSDAKNNVFVNKLLYRPHIRSCQNANVSNVKNTSFLVDSSGSMSSAPGGCPQDVIDALGGKDCTRMDVAHWAMRRVVSSRIYGNGLIDDPGQTSLTGFTDTRDSDGDFIYTVDAVEQQINDTDGNSTILFDDPSDPSYTAPEIDEILVGLETKLSALCPTGYTPLGNHLEALANQMGAGDVDRPNKIVVISDGKSNKGVSPQDAITKIRADYGDGIEIDIISMIKNTAFESLEDPGNGIRYFESTDPDELLTSLYNSAGICSPPPVPTITDQINCK